MATDPTRRTLWEIYFAGTTNAPLSANDLIEKLMERFSALLVDVKFAGSNLGNNKIPLIKLLREAGGRDPGTGNCILGLAEAKDMAESGVLKPEYQTKEVMEFLENNLLIP
jgi:hypothetical protein